MLSCFYGPPLIEPEPEDERPEPTTQPSEEGYSPSDAPVNDPVGQMPDLPPEPNNSIPLDFARMSLMRKARNRSKRGLKPMAVPVASVETGPPPVPRKDEPGITLEDLKTIKALKDRLGVERLERILAMLR